MHRVCGVLWLPETVQAIQGSEKGKNRQSGRELYTAAPSSRMALPQVAGAGVEVANRYAADLVVKTLVQPAPASPVLLMPVLFVRRT
jgi:hypothetical protein